MRFRVGAAGALAALFAVLAFTVPAHATLPGPNGKIAFHSNREGTQDLWTMNADGSVQTRITAGAGTEQYPAWSPDGRDIAYVRGGQHLVVIDAVGTDPWQVTTVSSDRRRPTWSPDASRLAYQFLNQFIAWTDLSGAGNEAAITEPQPEEVATDDAPDWSPDGGTIVFERCFCHPFGNDYLQIWAIGANGVDERPLTTDHLRDRQPSISPDGGTVVFEREAGGEAELFTVPLAGGTPVQVTDTPGFSELSPVWSPDGTKIAFTGVPDDTLNHDIYVVNADGSGQQRLTTDPGRDSEPSWQRVVPGVNGFPRPKGATPIRVPLVPAYQACAAPNETHGPPLSFGSCAPPARASQYATVGTPDANALPAQSVGSLKIDALVGDISTLADEADVRFRLSISDVRRSESPAVAYPFELFAQLPFRLTDKAIGCCDEPGTISGTFDVSMAVPCSAGSGEGATCSLTTTADTLVPGAVREGKRSIWELVTPVRVYDAGEDGHASSMDDNTLFATQGLFIP